MCIGPDPWVWAEHKAAAKRKRRKTKQREKRARLAKANKASGSRFERAVVLAFRARGLTAERVDESNGFVRGWDIQVDKFPDMVVQCKATQTKAALLNGINEARKHNPGAQFWVCFHSFRPSGKKVQIRVAYSSRPEGPPSITDPDGFFHVLLRSHYNGWGYPDA
jgi:hypothetical protein